MAFSGSLFICLLAGHFIGDFLLQTRKDVEDKRGADKKKSLLVLLKHTCVVTVVSYLICGVWLVWQIPLLVFISHLVLDLIKARARSDSARKERTLFVADQVGHILSLLLISFVPILIGGINLYWLDLWGGFYVRAVVVTAGLVAVVLVGGMLTAMLVKPFQTMLDKDELGLKNAGLVIGQLERSLIYLFVLLGRFEVIGFLIAAKSIFRFGTLAESKNRKMAEYILIGTMISFTYATALSVGVQYLLASL